jgi:hypothetical protein
MNLENQRSKKAGRTYADGIAIGLGLSKWPNGRALPDGNAVDIGTANFFIFGLGSGRCWTGTTAGLGGAMPTAMPSA